MNSQRPKPFIFIVLDGLGMDEPNRGNAVTLGKTPNLDYIWENYPHTFLQAAGNYVGLPKGVQGNSEVGHMSLGAGKVVFQEMARIDHEIEYESFFKNEMFINCINHAKSNNSKLHLMGCLSNGNVHSSLHHVFACLEMCKRQGLTGDKVAIHAFTDGRDTKPKQAEEFLSQLDTQMSQKGVGKLASLIGRYYAMDRDSRWDRTQLAYDLLVHGKGTQVGSWKEAIDKSYSEEIHDEHLKPFVIVQGGQPVATIKAGDAIIFFNYRADRAVQLSQAIEHDPFEGWQREKLQNVFYAGFSNYEKGFSMNRAKEDEDDNNGESGMVQAYMKEEMKKSGQFPEKQIFPPERLKFSLGKMVSAVGMKQLRIAESEKFPHVTYFFNGREKYPFEGEDRIEIPSPKDVATYDLKPEMSSYELTDELLKKIDTGTYDFILVNFACTDMVAHTGNLAASIRAVEVADECVGAIVKRAFGKDKKD